jgi:ZIP family zinc transporter
MITKTQQQESVAGDDVISEEEDQILSEVKDEKLGKAFLDKKNSAFKLFLAATLHNIPEGVACGLVYGSALKQAGEQQKAALSSAIGLAIGMGIQNIPEGAAVALPIKEISDSVLKGFLYGMFSGIVEPIFAILSLFISKALVAIDPWVLAFSAGAMLYVTIEELVPESARGGYPKTGIWSFVVGFMLMMTLEFAISF